MAQKTVMCKSCDWQGPEDVLEGYKCPKCGSRRLKTSGSRLSSDENRQPPKGVDQGEDSTGLGGS